MKTKLEFVGIQYLRGFAALLVVLDHASGMTALPKYFRTMAFDGFLDWGFVGVDLFFSISGFIIALVTLSPITLEPKSSLSDFLTRRVVRIVPFLWFCVLCYAGLKFIGRGGDFSIIPYIRSLLLWPVGRLQPNVVWTLRHEMLFYLLFSILLIKRKTGSIILLVWILSPFIFPLEQVKPSDGLILEVYMLIVNPVNILFASGLVVAGIYLRTGTRTTESLSGPLGVGITFLGAIMLIVLSRELHYSRTAPLQVILVATVSGAFILLSLRIPSTSVTGYSERFARVLGNASYSIYLTHEAVISTALTFWSRLRPSTDSRFVVIVATLVAVLLGILIHFVVEKPLIANAAKFTRRHVVKASL